MEPPSLATELRKLLLWLTLACFSFKIRPKTDRSDLKVSLKTIEMGAVLLKNGRGI
jgi:hypothetical protein